MMSLPNIEPPILWRRPENIDVIVQYLLEAVDDDPHLSTSALASDPAAHLQDSGTISVSATDMPLDDGGIQGSYDSLGPTIRYNRSNTPERDAFTVLHEFGHHLQRSNFAWAFGVLQQLSRFERALLEERVCDEFASRVLISDTEVTAAGVDVDSAYLEVLYRRSNASRRATVMRARGVAAAQRILFAVVDAAGSVSFSTTTSDDLPQLPSGSVQPDLADLFAAAAGSGRTVVGTAHHGLRYTTGNARSDLSLSLTVDSSGLFAFATARPTYAYGDQLWRAEERECVSEACAEIFTWNADTVVCKKCSDPKCPACGSCACEVEVPVCPNCFFELAIADIQAGRLEHDECP